MRALQIGPFTIEALPEGHEPRWLQMESDTWADSGCLVTWETPGRTITFDHGWISFLSVLTRGVVTCTREGRRALGERTDDDIPDIVCVAHDDGTVTISMDRDGPGTRHDHLAMIKKAYTALYQKGAEAIAEGRLGGVLNGLSVSLPIGQERLVWESGQDGFKGE